MDSRPAFAVTSTDRVGAFRLVLRRFLQIYPTVGAVHLGGSLRLCSARRPKRDQKRGPLWRPANWDRVMEEQPEAQSIVFVIDDDVSVREALKSLFRSVGMRVEAFSSTAEFLKHRRPEATACLVLDIRMPGVSGLDFQVELAKAGIRIPVIFITGHGDIPMSVRAMKAGAVEFLTKPFREQDLLDAVQIGLSTIERNGRWTRRSVRCAPISRP